MKEGFENIDEVFKKAFDAFEADVDPGVWNNVQSSISSGSNAGSNSQVNPSTTTGAVGKSVALKIVASAIAIGTIVTGAYFIADESVGEIEDAIVENVDSKESSAEITLSENVQKENSSKNITPEKIIITKDDENVEKESVNNLSVEEQSLLEEPLEVNNATKENSEPEEKLEKPVAEEFVTTTKKEKEEQLVLRAVIKTDVNSGKAPLDVAFNVDGENIVSYLWDFGDNTSISNEESSFHTFEKPGVYKVSLTIIDKNANSKTFLQFIEVEENVISSLGVIPNAFDPNGDGINDVYKVKGENISVFNARVMNSNGKLIYEWTSIEEGWDGKDKFGNKLPVGTYYLFLYAKGSDGKEYSPKQAIHLLE